MDAEAIDQLNRAITGDYRRLSTQMRAFLDVEYLDWCGFAAWSSHTIGASIGDLARPDNAFHQLPRLTRLLTRGVRRFLTGGDAVGRLVDGNIAIYTEMRAVYEAIMAADRTLPLDERVEWVVDRSADAMLPGNPVNEDEWASVREGSRCYLAASSSEVDERRRRELVLAAAAHFSAFEQARVDAMLDEFMYAPTRRLRARFLRWVPGGFGDPDRRTFLEAFSAWAFTTFLTVLVTARGPMRLGAKFELPPAGEYPTGENPLGNIEAPEAGAALERYGPDLRPNISDWSRYEERMRVIVAYFRAYQHVPAMVSFGHLPDPPANPPVPPPISGS